MSAPCTDMMHHEAAATTAETAGAPTECSGGHAMTFSHSFGPVAVLHASVVAGPSLVSYAIVFILVVLAGVARQDLLKRADDKTLTANARTCLFCAQATLAYLLMLVSMTYNVGLFTAVILGLTLGHRRSLMTAEVDKSECCS